MTVWTIGHSTRSFHDFLDALNDQRIEAIADVRKLPGSRKFPQFNQEELSVSLNENGIGYRHFPNLGGRRKPRKNSPNDSWRHPAFRGYADFMETAEFAEGISDLTRFAKKQRTAILCAEAVWWSCHRSLISDHLKFHGWKVLHIFAPGTIKEHPYTAAARIDEHNCLSYSKTARPLRQ